MKVAKKFAGKDVNFAVGSLDDFAREVGEFGFADASGETPIVAGRNAAGDKFAMQEKFRLVIYSFVTCYSKRYLSALATSYWFGMNWGV